MAYAFQGSCDSHLRGSTWEGVEALAAYSGADAASIARFTVQAGIVTTDSLDRRRLRLWVDGCDPETGERRGRDLTSPDADLLLDGTINAPKSYSVAALINTDLATEFEALQDRLRDRIITTWQHELNARRGAGGRIREPLARIEVVELRHRRSRALDPHIHRHLWLSVKVLGEDGKWSNIDSRVAMKLHTVINAEGELAARTDPQWLAALARHGCTLNQDGEIAELAHAVRPLSRRSTQIEANRAMLLAAWRVEHPGEEPGPDALHQLDRLAWAKSRPNKPGDVDESEWEQLIAEELRVIDPAILDARRPVCVASTAIERLDIPLLAARAVVEADTRGACCGGRFSLFDVRAGATRAVAASGVVMDRDALQPTIDRVVGAALEHTVNLLDGEQDCPAHVKGFMASGTAALKLELAARFDALTRSGDAVATEQVIKAAARVLAEDVSLDERQVAAASVIAGSDRLVSVTGPAGAGKTTMLRVAKAALAQRRCRMVVVAPTKKAASVAGREIGTSASSLHALLADHGYRWGRDAAGAELWTRLKRGEIDAVTGLVYEGPRRFALSAGDRVVVDEAGMVDLHTANALAEVAADSGAGIAMVGDHLQARPVGHSGAMATLTRRATAVVELTAVHRFRDPDYAALTLRMREPESKDAALAVAGELSERELIHRVADRVQARDVMVEAYFRWAANHGRVALVTSTNEEAEAINEAIQQRRVDHGQLDLHRIAVGQGEQRLLEGDIVQTRRNDRAADVENRAVWSIHRITETGLELVSLNDSGDLRTVGHEYAAVHVHLAYASTVHGIQGETTDAAVVGPGVDAAGLYVGMTRGRTHNEVIAIARTDAAARDQVADTMLRGIPEVSIDDSIRAARAELGRAAKSPVSERPVATAAWNDRARRPHGAVPNINGAIAHAHEREHDLGNRARELSGWLDAAGTKILELDVQLSHRDAIDHARGLSRSDGPLSDARVKLRERFDLRSKDYAELMAGYGAAAAAVQQLELERQHRAQLDPSSRAVEERARGAASEPVRAFAEPGGRTLSR